MKKSVILLLILPLVSFGYPLNAKFETRQKEYGAILIDWKTADNPALACQSASAMKSYNPNILACAVRRGLRCTIYTSRHLDLATLGHEIRHCYEGLWHGEKEHITG